MSVTYEQPHALQDVPNETTATNLQAGSELAPARCCAAPREIEVIALEPKGFTSRKVANIRQAALYAEWLLETGATKISIYVSQIEAQHNDSN